MHRDLEAVRVILVPLDGSTLAEQALPVAEHIAHATGSSLLLAHVISPLTWAFATPDNLVGIDVYQDLLQQEEREARAYLAHMKAHLPEQGISVRTGALRGETATTLIDMAHSEGADLVVMTTHGRTGLARAALGSVADAMVRESDVPVLLLRTTTDARWHDGDTRQVPLERALVPLDGSQLAEAALGVIASLAGTVIRQIRLVRVVSSSLLDEETQAAQHYLKEMAASLRARLQERNSQCTVSITVKHGAAAEELLTEARDTCDLIVMATRGQSGIRRLILGSVAEQVVHNAHMPILVVRPERFLTR